MKRRCTSGLFAVMFILAMAAALPVRAAIYGGYSEYYIPGHEDQMYGIFNSLGTYQGAPVASGPGMHSVISVTASEDNTTIYYDHWEDGYEFDQNNPDNTYDLKYVLQKGEVLSLVGSNIPCAPRGTATFFDGGDRLYSAGTSITVSRSSWPEDSGPVLAVAWELLPVKPFLTDYTIPVGNNLTNYEDFSRTYVLVQSVSDNNIVQIDDPTTPGVDVVVTLNKGGATQLYNVNAGTKVTGQQPVQVHFIVGRDTGDYNAYEARGYNAVPDSLWDNEYMCPVGSQGNSADVDIYLYNPHASAILVEWADTSGSGSFSVPAHGTLSYSDGAGHYVPQNSGAYVRSDSIFWGIASSDTESRTYDWGFSLIPINFLTDEYFLSWAPGTSDPTPTANGSPAFVAAIYDDTVVFVDYSPTDDVVDAQYTLDRLQSQKIFDPDNDNTGMHIFATGPLAMAWGQDANAADTGNPFLDLGTSNLPMPKQWIDLTLGIEKTASPSVLPPISGSETTFILEISSYDYPVYDISVVDLMPPGFTFKNNSTKITFPSGMQKTGTAANPTLVLNPDGQQIVTWDNTVLNGLDMIANQKLTVTFDAVTDGTVTVNTYTNKAQAIGERLGGSQIFSPFDSVPIYVTALTIDKDTSTTVIAAGGTATYTIRLKNISNLPATGISITDSRANTTNFTYVAAAATITRYNSAGTVLSSITDTNDGSWNIPWTLAAGEYVVVQFGVKTANATPPASYDSNAEASFTWNGSSDSIDDKGRVAQDSGTPDGEDPEPDENVQVSSLLINKSTSTPVVSAGGTATYKIYMENFGDGAVTGVDITDALPGGFNLASASVSITLNSASQQAGWSQPANGATNLHWGPWTINSGGSITIDFNVNIPANAAPLTYDNTVVADSNETGTIDDAGTVGHWLNDDPGTGIIADTHTPATDTENDDDVTVSTAVLQIDMDSITKYTINGGNASYQIKVLNAGTSNATSTVVDATLPTGFTNNSAATIKLYNASGTEINSASVTRGGTASSPTWNVPWAISPNEYVIVTFNTAVNTTFVGIVQSNAGAVSTQTARITDIGNLGYNTGTIPLADPVTDEDVQVLTIPACDLQVLKSHSGNFTAAGPNSFSIVVTNNGPSVHPNTSQITVTDTLPTGLTYLGYSGSGWTCTAAGQLITCRRNTTVAVGTSLPAITLNVGVNTATAPLSVNNTATVASPVNDHIPANNTSTDTVTILMPDLEGSTKTVLDINGGDAQSGDLLRYTIKLVEGNGLPATGVQVTDNIPNYVTGFTAAGVVVKNSSGTTLTPGTDYLNQSLPAPAGSNLKGLLDLRNLTIPANDFVTITFNVNVAAGTAQGSAIANTAIINNPNGPNESRDAPTLIVQASQIPATGVKPLYLYGNQTMSRVPSLPPQDYVDVPENITRTWTLSPAIAAQLIVSNTNNTIPVILNVRNDDGSTHRHDMTVSLGYGGSLNNIGSVNINNYDLGPTIQTLTFNVPIAANHTITAGTAITMSFLADDDEGNDGIWVYPIATVGGLQVSSKVNLKANTVINVDSVTFYDSTYPGGAALTTVVPGTTLYVRTVVSDPFGSFDINSARITIVDSEGNLVTNNVLMQQKASTGATKTYEHSFTIPPAGPVDNWTASVTAREGTENTISDTGVGVITVNAVSGADLQIIKSHVGSFFKNSNGTFTLNVTNFGPEAQTAPIVVRDTIPAGLSYVGSSGSDWTVNTTALPNVVWTYPASAGTPVAAGTNLPPISLTVKVEQTAAATIQNTATVDPGVGSNNLTNNSSTDTVYIVAQNVVKTVDVASPYYQGDSAGNIMTYTMTVSNNGAGPMTNLAISDPLPAGTSYVANSTTVSALAPVIRVTEYYVSNTAPGFTTTSYNLILNQNLAANYFVIIQGSDGDGATRTPDQNYVSLTGDPAGTGDLAVSGAPNSLSFTRHGNDSGWRGVITVVESLRDNSGSGFLLRDVGRVAHNTTSTAGTAPIINGWTDINRVMLLGGFNGAGCDTTTTNSANHNSCHARIYPSGSGASSLINWSRNGGGVTLQTATSTVMAIEWGSNWNVQRVHVAGNAGNNGAATAAAYVTAPISGVNRANTWVWGTGHTSDNGIGDAGEGVLITLGDDFGVTDPPNTVENQVAIGIEVGRDMDFEVYALTHPSLAVDYRFKADGDTTATVYNQTVDAASGNRMALITNGSNGTGTAYPRPIWSARYTANNNVQLERRYNGQDWPAWIQGINFSGIVSTGDVSGGAPPNLVTAANGYSLQPGQSMTVTFKAAIVNADLPQAISNTVSVTSTQNTVPATAAVVTEVRTLGVPDFTDKTGNPVTTYNLDGNGEPVYVKVFDPDRNTNSNTIQFITVSVRNPLNGDIVVLTLYETGINTGIFANDINGDSLIVPLAPCQDPSSNCCEPDLGIDGCEGDVMPDAANSLWVEGGTTPNLELTYTDPANPGRDSAATVASVATQVVLADFGAFARQGQSVIFWETASETGTAAFNLLRRDETTGNYTRINKRPIPSLRGQTQGGFYRLVDRQVTPGATVTYQLEEIENSGRKILYGPFTVIVGDVPEKILALHETNRMIQRGAHPRNAEPGVKQGPSAGHGRFARLRQAAASNALKISVTNAGFYYLGNAEIANLFGLEERIVARAIARGNMDLSRNGTSVPYLPTPSMSGLFFYGANIDSIYTASNIYWLKFGKGLLMQTNAPVGDVTGSGEVGLEDVIAALKVVSGIRPAGVRSDYLSSGTDVNDNNKVDLAEALYALKMQSGSQVASDSGAVLPAGEDNQSFMASLRLEENWYANTDVFKDPTADYWVWDYMDGGWAGYDYLEVPITLKGWNTDGTIGLTIDLFSSNDTPAAVDHHVLVSLNGVQIGEAQWSGIAPYSLEISDIDVTGEDIDFQNNGTDFLTIQTLLEQPGVDEYDQLSYVALDGITIHYPRTAIAIGNQLALQGDEHAVLSVSGFSSPEIQVLNISNPYQPQLIKATSIDDSAGGHRVSFAPITPETAYYVVVPDTAMVPDQVLAVNNTELKAVENDFDYLVIAAEDFAAEAQLLVDYRETKGLRGRVVTVEEIVDGFNFGIPGPQAIKEFLKFAWQNWQQQPRYVVLAGNGTYDYQGFEGAGDNFVPTQMMATPNGLFASDQLLADVSGDDGVPDLAIGRLPATSASELTDLINRIKTFENGSGDWRQQVLVLAGSPEHSGETNDFKSDSLSVSSLLPDSFTKHFLFQDDGATYMDVISRLNQGALYMNYIGHGGYDRLAGNALLAYSKNPYPPWSRNDLLALTNVNERPVLAALTCIVGNFARPGYDFLAEALVKSTTGGAIAVWSPSGLSINDKAVWLNKEFARQMSAHAGSDVHLGDLILSSLQRYNVRYGDRMLVGLYNLLGDPALIIPVPE